MNVLRFKAAAILALSSAAMFVAMPVFGAGPIREGLEKLFGHPEVQRADQVTGITSGSRIAEGCEQMILPRKPARIR